MRTVFSSCQVCRDHRAADYLAHIGNNVHVIDGKVHVTALGSMPPIDARTYSSLLSIAAKVADQQQEAYERHHTPLPME